MQRTGPLDIFKEAKYWKTDVPSGLVVFLVALPLCLGIALASGGSAMSGIIAGIVGGLVVTLFSNSSLGVSGPAAGLVAICCASDSHTWLSELSVGRCFGRCDSVCPWYAQSRHHRHFHHRRVNRDQVAFRPT